MKKILLKLKPYFRSDNGEKIDELTDSDYVPNCNVINRTLTIKCALETRFKWFQWTVIYTRNEHHGEMELFIEGVNEVNKNKPIIVSGEEQSKRINWGIDKGDISVCCSEPFLSVGVSYVVKGVCPPKEILAYNGSSQRKHMENVSKKTQREKKFKLRDLKLFKSDKDSESFRYARPGVVFLPTNLTKRTPCGHQGHSHKCFKEEDNPCLICAGNIRVLGRGDIFMCPFEDSRDQKTVYLKESINIKFITASERYFIIQQEEKK